MRRTWRIRSVKAAASAARVARRTTGANRQRCASCRFRTQTAPRLVEKPASRIAREGAPAIAQPEQRQVHVPGARATQQASVAILKHPALGSIGSQATGISMVLTLLRARAGRTVRAALTVPAEECANSPPRMRTGVPDGISWAKPPAARRCGVAAACMALAISTQTTPPSARHAARARPFTRFHRPQAAWEPREPACDRRDHVIRLTPHSDPRCLARGRSRSQHLSVVTKTLLTKR